MYVTFETAKALRDAGYPQPRPIVGHIWYRIYQGAPILAICSDVGSDGEIIYTFTYSFKSEDNLYFRTYPQLLGAALRTFSQFSDEIKSMIFAPAATDILRELGDCATIVFHENATPNGDGVFQVWTDGYMKAINTNPAEACAKAWLSKNVNK